MKSLAGAQSVEKAEADPSMIPPARHPRHLAAWRRELAEAVTDPAELLALLGLDPGLLPAARQAAACFGLRVPRGFLALMENGNPADPLLRQVLPIAAETHRTPGYGPDPVGDLAALRGPGVLAKYGGRALMMTTGACAVHCRYCFRRDFPYAEGALTPARLEAAVAELAAMPALEEVILSGGDPLALPTPRLAAITRALARLPRLARLRIHTRTPVVLPARVDEELQEWLLGLPWRSVIVLHVNHPRELSPALVSAIAKLAAAGVTLLNQSVLLRGVNDDEETLAELSTALFGAGVLPYYLHLLDHAAGLAHFDVPEADAAQLHLGMLRRLPGYLVPRLVREEAGGEFKTPVTTARGRAERC